MMTHAKLATIGVDVVAGATVVGSLFGYLPAIASGIASVYYLIMIYFALTKKRNDD